MTKKSICIISLSPIYRDARVLRQIKYLSPHYHLTVVGYGPPHSAWKDNTYVDWVSLDKSQLAKQPPVSKGLLGELKKNTPPAVKIAKGKIFSLIEQRVDLLVRGVLARYIPAIYERWYWKRYTGLLHRLMAIQCDAYHANDWVTLPIAAEAAKHNNARVVCDLHEYAPLQRADDKHWRWTETPMITFFLQKYAPLLSASMTVGPMIAERYSQEFHLSPIVVFNAPAYETIPYREPDAYHIRLVHHGGASRIRRLETMIQALALCDERYSLHFMLVESNSGYIDELKQLANDIVPERVTFHRPVRPEEVVQNIAVHDIGFYPLYPVNYNNTAALPNKLFDFIVAGLAICIGPSPEMAKLVNQYGCGCVTPSFEPQDVANTLNQLTIDNIKAMQQASREAAKHLNADIEMGKVVDLYARLLANQE